MPTEAEAVENIRIGARIRAIRKEQGVVARQLADRIGCSESHIFNIEAGRARITVENRAAIADALRVSLATLEEAS